MQLCAEISGKKLLPNVTIIGFLDGVHRGHRFLIEQTCETAAACGLASLAITFPVHPCRVMHPDFHSELLTTCDGKTALPADISIDYCIMSDFTPDLARFSAKQFMAVLEGDYQIQALVIGYNHRFEHNRSEDSDDYVCYGRELGMEVILAQAYSNSEMTVSSLTTRHLLLEGDVPETVNCLGYHLFLNGTAVNGYHVGRKVGFPITNLCINDSEKLIPVDGVHAVNVFFGETEHTGTLSIGYRPTLNNGLDRSVEVHIFHFDADIYDQPMRISFIRRTRPGLKFDSTEELIKQLHKDETEIIAIFSLR